MAIRPVHALPEPTIVDDLNHPSELRMNDLNRLARVNCEDATDASLLAARRSKLEASVLDLNCIVDDVGAVETRTVFIYFTANEDCGGILKHHSGAA